MLYASHELVAYSSTLHTALFLTALVLLLPLQLPLQDLFQHNAWAVKVAGMEAADAARMKRVDFSAFYNKFGMDGGDAEQQ
jgi:hypothetical protein